MKVCPKCAAGYSDALNFCLEDGEWLHSAEAEPATAILHSTEEPSVEPATIAFDQNVSGGNDDLSAVAVLPFANLSKNEDNEYFSDGLAEELLNVLSKIRGLRVAARTSAFAFKGKQASIEEIGRALRVKSVLEGSVRMAGERVRVAVQLVGVENGYHLWSETYDRKMDDIFAIQDDIAHSVVGELRERFLGPEIDPNAREKVADEIAKAIKGRAANPEAHRLMLLGKHLLKRANENDAIKAVQYFREALDIDPDHSLSWAQLGRAYYLASSYGWSALDTDYENAEEACQLELEPDLAEAHARLGRIRWYRDGDFLGSEQCLNRALALAPENTDVLLTAATAARELGQYEKGIFYSRRAAAIDPLSPRAWGAATRTNFFAGNLSEAEFAAHRELELAPQRITTHACLGLVLLKQGRVDEALAEALLEPENNAWRSWSLTIIHYAAGRSGESDLELAKLIAEFSDGFAFQIAEAHSMRGEPDAAFEWLERAIEQRDPGRLTTKVSPLLKPLHADPRWAPLLKKVGFPEEGNNGQ